jgi:GT2 family glycosyltransferase
MQAVYPKIAIVILNWNGLSDTLECIESLKTIVYPNYVIVVIDNASKGSDAEVIQEKFGDFVCVIEEEKNIGFAGGCNKGIRWAQHSGADYILLLNNDTIVDSNFLIELVNIAQNDAQIGIVGPKICYYEQPNKIWSAGGKINFWTGITRFIGRDEIDNGQSGCIEDVDFVSGAALLIKEKTIRTIGLLNETYFAYYEETEWCTRAKRAGFKVVCVPNSRIWHKVYKRRISEIEIYYMTRNRFIFVKRNSDAVQLVFFGLFFLTTDLLGQIKTKLFMRPKSFVAYLRGVCDGLLSLAHE